jgi:acetate---CoA ligase (ADP-forming)
MASEPIRAIDYLFAPRTIAVAGASANQKNLGSRTLKLIKDFGFAGPMYAVNPKAEPSSGVSGYSSLAEVPGEVDLCLVVVPAKFALKVIEDCAKRAVPIAQVLTGGFAETGTAGKDAERRLVEAAAGRTRLVGPNCIGVYSPTGRLTMVAHAEMRPGPVAIASQSGGLSIDMILQARSRGLKLSKLISIGNCMDLDPVDFLNYFAWDEKTQVIGLYIEGLKRGREFLSALREIAPHKPVAILKGGRTSQGARSVASHTNSLAGDFAIWKAAAHQTGVVVAENVDDFLAALTALQPGIHRPQGPGLALVGNGGGATVLATDLSEELGLHLAELTPASKEKMAAISMPPGSTVGNPTDTPVGALNKAGGESLGRVIETILADENVHGMVIHFNLVPFINYTNRQEIAEGLAAAIVQATTTSKTVFLALRSVSDPRLDPIRDYLLGVADQAKLPCFRSADEAVAAIARAYRHATCVTGSKLLNAQDLVSENALASARNLVKLRMADGINYLGQKDCFDLLTHFGIGQAPCCLADSEDQAADAASEIGFPVVLKIDSLDIVHKSEAGGVKIGIKNSDEVRSTFKSIIEAARAYRPDARINGVLVQGMLTGLSLEMICGLKRDPVFGPVLVVGMGGVLVEIMRDVSMRVLPLSDTDPARLWRELRSAPLLTGYRGKPPADTEALEELIRRLAILGEALPEVLELDLNPVCLGSIGEGAKALDARIFLAPVG